MKNEFEALKHISIRCHQKVVWDDPIDSDLDTVKQALVELQAIKEAKPNEALENLEKMYDNIESPFPSDKELYDSIKQALLKSQETEKVLEVLFKYFDINVVISNKSAFGCITIQRKGCNQMPHQAQKTTFKEEEQKEFDTLKRWCEK